MRSEDLDLSELFEKMIEDESFKADVPLFEGRPVSDGQSLVRYVGLVQVRARLK